MGTLDRDTLHLLFPGLNKLLNFQRKFLIKVESIAELPWHEQRWGVLFSENVSYFMRVNAPEAILNAELPLCLCRACTRIVSDDNLLADLGTIGGGVCRLRTLLR